MTEAIPPTWRCSAMRSATTRRTMRRCVRQRCRPALFDHMGSIHQLLVPVDGSPTSIKALDTAIRLARLNGACVRLFHVIDELDHVNGFETPKAYKEDLVPLMRARGEKMLAQMRRRVTDQGLVCDSVLVGVGRRPR